MLKLFTASRVVAGLAFVVFVALASGGPGWGASSSHAILAVRLDHSAGAPLYDVIASVAALLPFGEPAFRIQLLGALLGALTLAGVIAAGRALLPKESSAGIAAAVLLALAPPFREALATPDILAACGIVWTIAWLRTGDHVRALATTALVVGSAPWLGIATVLAVMAIATAAKPTVTRSPPAPAAKSRTRKMSTAAKGAPRPATSLGHGARVALGVAGIGVMIVLLWFDAVGSWPAIRADLASAVASSGRGAVVIGVGLLGIAFGAVTGLMFAARLAAIVALVAANTILVGNPGVLVAVLALGVAIVIAAIARMLIPPEDTVRPADAEKPFALGLTGWKRDAAVAACGAPLLVAALATGFGTDDPGSTPRTLAHDLVDEIPTGPGTFVATRPAGLFALDYERAIAGLRPDLALVVSKDDVLVADTLRKHQIVGSDSAGFGRLDLARAQPRGRGFQLQGIRAEPAPVLPIAGYESALGKDEALALALERAEAEAASGRLAGAARALELQDRFGAADLAVLAATQPSRDRPALFGYLPPQPRGEWVKDAFADDLAWMANIPVAEPPATSPAPRRLLALWRKILLGTAKPEEAAQLGSDAADATAAVLHDLGR